MADKKREQKPLATALDGVKREFSAGGIVYKRDNGNIKWLVIQPVGTDRWQLPKGNIEQGEKAQETAVREVFEETSVHARIVEKIDTVRYFYVRDGARIVKSVTFFLMGYDSGKVGVSKVAEHEIAEVKFVPTDDAVAQLTFKDDKEVVRKAGERLREGIQESLV